MINYYYKDIQGDFQMKREKLLKKIDELKNIMPWYVLDYYQSKLSVPYSFTALYECLGGYRRCFEWILD